MRSAIAFLGTIFNGFERREICDFFENGDIFLLCGYVSGILITLLGFAISLFSLNFWWHWQLI